MKKRALISVSDKAGIYEFAKGLIDFGYEIISTGGTASLLKEKGLPIISVDEITNFPECLDGRVKTLHPHIHGGILPIRSNESHMNRIAELGIEPIDMVVVNLYPFRSVVEKDDHTLAEAIENIDIGGPSMIRAAAKNYPFVAVVTDSRDYETVLENIKNDKMDKDYHFSLAVKAFAHTASYDALIANYLQNVLDKEAYPEFVTMTFEKKQDLRYGENPHQSAGYYEQPLSKNCGIDKAVCVHGKELSYNNINDTQGAIALACEFEEPVCVAVKHSTPCGVGVADTVLEAYTKAYDADPVSIFGGIVCFNREVDVATADKMYDVFLEVIVAPSFSEDALDRLQKKKNLRLMVLPSLKNAVNERAPRIEFKSVAGGLLMQQTDMSDIAKEEKNIATEKAPDVSVMNDLDFAMKVVKHVKSNAIVVVKNGQTLGIGGGEVSRIWAAQAALARAGEQAKGAVIGSDAFFPFPDVVEVCADAGIQAIIQPGGSKNDQLSVDECNKRGIAMVFTGVRHFKH